MTDTELTVVESAEAGATVALTTPNISPNTHYFDNDGHTVLFVMNAGGSSDNVIFTGVGACAFGVVHDRTVAVGAGVNKIIGPFNTAHFNNATGHVSLTHSFVTSVTQVALRVPKVQ